MNITGVVPIVLLSFIYFDFASRSKLIARLLVALWSFIWLVLFWKRVTRFELEIPTAWFWKITNGKAAVSFFLASLSFLAGWLLFGIHDSIWFLLIPLSGVTGFAIYVYKTARQMRWKEMTKVYKIGKCFKMLKDELYSSN